MAEAFTAGVKPGGLTDNTQIRILLCYLVKTAGPLTRDTLQGALLQEQLVNYFEFADALADVERQQLVSLDEDERYSITDKGSTVADTLAFDLPRTVRESAIRAVMQIQSWKHKAAMNRARIEEEDGEYVVWCAIGDMGSDVFRLQLAMPDKLTAETIRNNFTAHGSEIYSKVMNMLTQPSTEEDRPPARASVKQTRKLLVPILGTGRFSFLLAEAVSSPGRLCAPRCCWRVRSLRLPF